MTAQYLLIAQAFFERRDRMAPCVVTPVDGVQFEMLLGALPVGFEKDPRMIIYVTMTNVIQVRCNLYCVRLSGYT